MHRQHHKRQAQSSLLSVPSADGLNGNGITAGGDSTGTVLAFNTASGASESAPPLQFGGSGITMTSTTPPGDSTSSTSIAEPSSTDSKNHNSISVSTVVAVCIGAFVGAGLLICLSVAVYRRSSRRPSRARSAPRSAGIHDGRTGHSEAWKKLDDDQDRWEAKAQTREVEKGELKKLPTIPQRPSSFKIQEFSAAGDRPDFDRTSFSTYHPGLAEELAQPSKAFMGHKGGVSSWGGSTAVTDRDDPLLSLRSVHIESGAMSPSLSAAKITPPSTASGFHRWESAEVILPDDRPILKHTPINPFADATQDLVRKKSRSNPFFGAQTPMTQSIGRKTPPTPPQNPFTDKSAADHIPHVVHVQNDSVASNSGSEYGTDRAMQSLIDALNLPQSEGEKRLRIASMQPSEMSRYSNMTSESLYGQESMFPNPPEAR
jgi:hypothetical protein